MSDGWRIGCVAGLCLSLVMCGAEAPSAKAPSSAAPAYSPPGQGEPSADGAAAATPPPPSPPAEAAASAPGEPSGRRVLARRELERSEEELKASPGDCGTACRALTSMEHAAVELCALVGEADDQARCDDARRRLRAARDRVRNACGNCPGGPSVDRDAPVPSR